jgi:hypothetical protein
MDAKEKEMLFIMLNAIVSQLYSLELMMGDAYVGKLNLRFSSNILDQDMKMSAKIAEMVDKYLNEEKEDDKKGKIRRRIK